MEQAAEERKNRDKIKARWTLGLVLIGGNLFGLMFDSDALWAALRHRPFAYGTHSAVSELGTALGDFVLPIAVVSLAPRKSFLWGGMSLGITLAWSLMDRVVALNGPGFLHDFMENGTGYIISLLVLCGPISLIRFLVQRGRDRRLRRIAAQQAWLQQASEDQAGVWPPPVKPEGYSK